MKQLATVALVALLAATLAPSASAQDPYDAGVFFDPTGTQTSGPVTGFVPFFLYVVGFDLDGQIFGYEGELVNTPAGFFDPTTNPGGLTVLSAIFTGPAPLNVGTSTNFIVGTGGCLADQAGPLAIVCYNLGYFAGPAAPADLLFCLLPATPTSFEPATPGYLRCDGDLVAFGTASSGQGFYPDGCAVGNATQTPPVSTQATSFGAVKAGY